MPEVLLLSWEDICCSVPAPASAGGVRRILQGISGIAGRRAAAATEAGGDAKASPEAGSSICAVLGPSGAGKTTLIDILAGRKWDAGGTETPETLNYLTISVGM